MIGIGFPSRVSLCKVSSLDGEGDDVNTLADLHMSRFTVHTAQGNLDATARDQDLPFVDLDSPEYLELSYGADRESRIWTRGHVSIILVVCQARVEKDSWTE